MRNLTGLTFAQKVFVLNGGDLNPPEPTLEGRSRQSINDEWYDIALSLRNVVSYADALRRTEDIFFARYGKNRFKDNNSFVIFNSQRKARGMKHLRL